MRISGQEVKNLRFSSTDNDFDDRINYPIKEIWMNENYLEVFFFPGKGPSRTSAEMEKYEYRSKGEWITRAGRILSWNELYDYLKIFSVEESMKTFEQFNSVSESYGEVRGGINIQNPTDLANLVKGLRVINRDTLIASSIRTAEPLRDFLKRNGYTPTRDGDTVTFRKPGAKSIAYYNTPDDISLTIVMY